jgi:hypothetical protein
MYITSDHKSDQIIQNCVHIAHDMTMQNLSHSFLRTLCSYDTIYRTPNTGNRIPCEVVSCIGACRTTTVMLFVQFSWVSMTKLYLIFYKE